MATVNIGSHNSWSYARPRKWYIPRFVVRCQSVSIQEQYKIGARWFDLRLRLDAQGMWQVAHGACIFNVRYWDDLCWLNKQGDVYVRVLLEYNFKPKDEAKLIARFREVCELMEKCFGGIRFTGGCAKWSWEKIYDFKCYDPPFVDKYSSTTSLFKCKSKLLAVLDDWFPWLYAKLYNKKNYREHKAGKKEEYLLMDFVNMR